MRSRLVYIALLGGLLSSCNAGTGSSDNSQATETVAGDKAGSAVEGREGEQVKEGGSEIDKAKVESEVKERVEAIYKELETSSDAEIDAKYMSQALLKTYRAASEASKVVGGIFEDASHWKECNDMPERMKSEVGDVKIETGEKAKVEVRLSVEGESEKKIELEMTKEEGKWKVSDIVRTIEGEEYSLRESTEKMVEVGKATDKILDNIGGEWGWATKGAPELIIEIGVETYGEIREAKLKSCYLYRDIDFKNTNLFMNAEEGTINLYTPSNMTNRVDAKLKIERDGVMKGTIKVKRGEEGEEGEGGTWSEEKEIEMRRDYNFYDEAR